MQEKRDKRTIQFQFDDPCNVDLAWPYPMIGGVR
jgi:hypothetical protein